MRTQLISHEDFGLQRFGEVELQGMIADVVRLNEVCCQLDMAIRDDTAKGETEKERQVTIT